MTDLDYLEGVVANLEDDLREEKNARDLQDELLVRLERAVRILIEHGASQPHYAAVEARRVLDAS